MLTLSINFKLSNLRIMFVILKENDYKLFTDEKIETKI